MNIKELALRPELCNIDTFNNALVIFIAYKDQVDLDECIITFMYSISKFVEYQMFMKEKSKVLFNLMERHIDSDGEYQQESCRQKIFSTIHNMTENEEVCKQLNVTWFIQMTNKMFQQTEEGLYSSDHIHELALKSLINMCRYYTDNLEDVNLKQLFQELANQYPKFKSLSKQYSLRLVTILTRQWNQNKIEEYLVEIVEILSEFIANCTSEVEIKLVLINLEKIACFKNLMKALAEVDCQQLITNIASFLKRSLEEDTYVQASE